MTLVRLKPLIWRGSSDYGITLVVIGSHFDSVNQEGANYTAPGADDNASGSATILEAFRVLAEAGFAPKNTLEFHWYAGEEIGLVGSRDIWADYKSQGKSVLSYVNQDMTGYQPSGTPAIITDNTHQGLNKYVKLLVTEYTGKAPNTDKCGYACSDHASVTDNGFRTCCLPQGVDLANSDTAAAFLFEDLNDSNLNPHTSWDVSPTKCLILVRRIDTCSRLPTPSSGMLLSATSSSPLGTWWRLLT